MRTERWSKFNAKKTVYNGLKFDSKFEAGVAEFLDMQIKAGQIQSYECQFKIECIPYDHNGDPVPQCKVSHKVDFRVKNKDGSYTLLEAKGFETQDYRMRRKWLENFWLKANPDHEYQVIKQAKTQFKQKAKIRG